jgi:hypothetical protein
MATREEFRDWLRQQWMETAKLSNDNPRKPAQCEILNSVERMMEAVSIVDQYDADAATKLVDQIVDILKR